MPITEYRYTDTGGTKSGETWARANRDPAGNVTDRCTWTAAPAELCHLASDASWASPAPATRSSSRYDARSQQVELYTPGLGATTYDPAHNYQVAAVYTPTAAGKEHQTLYGYDARHRLTSITVRLCATSQRPCTGGNLLSETVANTYGYDDNDSRTSVVEDAGAGAVTRHYCHDARDQLVTVATAAGCGSGVLESYAYDAAGNRTSAAGRTFTYTAAGQLESCSGTACAPVFDADGRLSRITTASGTWSYLYDGESRLTSACLASSCTGSGFARLDLTYDGEGHRVRQIETPAAGTATTTDFRYEGDRVVAEVATTGDTVVTRTFTLDEAGTIVKLTIATTPTPGADDGTYLVTWNGHGDALAISEINADGTLTRANRFAYSTWGAPTLTAETGYGDLGFRYRYVGAAGVAWDDHASAACCSWLPATTARSSAASSSRTPRAPSRTSTRTRAIAQSPRWTRPGPGRLSQYAGTSPSPTSAGARTAMASGLGGTFLECHGSAFRLRSNGARPCSSSSRLGRGSTHSLFRLAAMSRDRSPTSSTATEPGQTFGAATRIVCTCGSIRALKSGRTSL